MKAHLAKLSLALLSTVFLLGCQKQASSPVEPDGVAPLFRPTCNENPGCKKNPGGADKGGDKSTIKIELGGGMVTTEAQSVQLSGQNNAKTLSLGGPASYTMSMINTLNAGLDDFAANCVKEGDFDGDFIDAEAMLRKIVDGVQLRHIGVTIDKAANGQESLKNNINSPWRDDDSESGNLISMSAIAGNGNKGAFALLPGATGPKVTAEATGDDDVTKYTFAADFGIMWIRQLGFSGLVVCHNRDEVVVTVDLTPTG